MNTPRFTTSIHRPTREQQGAVRSLVAHNGIDRAARLLRVARVTVERLMSGLGVQQRTIDRVSSALQERAA